MKNIIKIPLIIAVILVTQSMVFATGPLKTMRINERKVRKILKIKVKKASKAEKKKKNLLKTTVNNLFDYSELSKRALDQHWKELNKTQQADFVDTLQKLIEKSYLMKITSTTTYKSKIGHLKYNKDKTEASVDVKIKSGKYRFNLSFRMMIVSKKWYIFDMIIDNVSLIRNYRTQFNKIIKKDGFDKLLKKMKNKLNE